MPLGPPRLFGGNSSGRLARHSFGSSFAVSNHISKAPCRSPLFSSSLLSPLSPLSSSFTPPPPRFLLRSCPHFHYRPSHQSSRPSMIRHSQLFSFCDYFSSSWVCPERAIAKVTERRVLTYHWETSTRNLPCASLPTMVACPPDSSRVSRYRPTKGYSVRG